MTSLDDEHPTGEVQRLAHRILKECRNHSIGDITLLWKNTSHAYIALHSRWLRDNATGYSRN